MANIDDTVVICEDLMEFETFKKHIDRIQNTIEKEQKLSDCIEENLSSTTYCIVDISSEVRTSVEKLLADYYDCYYEILGIQENEISWWLYEEPEKRKLFVKGKNGNDKEIILKTIKQFWQYLERERKRNIKTVSPQKRKKMI